MKRLAVLLWAIVLAACVAVPHSVEPTIEETDTVVLPAEEILVTVGSRRFLASMEKAIAKDHPDIQILDALTFRDAAFPTGGWTLKEFLTPASCGRVQQQLAVDYLVLFGPLKLDEGGIRGPHMMNENLGGPLPLGVGQADYEATLSAVLIDLKTADVVCQVDVSAEGTARFVSYVYSFISYPKTVQSAVAGMARHLAATIAAHSEATRPRVVLMSAEATQFWAPIGESVEPALDSQD